MQAVAWIATLFVPALSILLHELGHFAVQALFGYEGNRITYAATTSSGLPSGINPGVADGLSFAAGSLVSLLLVAGAYWWIQRRRANHVAYGILMFACIRALVGLATQIGNVGVVRASLGFGELRYLSRTLGVSGPLETILSWLEFAIPFVAFTYAVRRHPLPRAGRAYPLVFALLVVGLVLWLGVIGSRVLPS